MAKLNRERMKHQKVCVMSHKTWGGRFDGETDKRVEAFTESITIDRRLYQYDITASKAHAGMLAEVGLITVAEAELIATTLDEIGVEIDNIRAAWRWARTASWIGVRILTTTDGSPNGAANGAARSRFE